MLKLNRFKATQAPLKGAVTQQATGNVNEQCSEKEQLRSWTLILTCNKKCLPMKIQMHMQTLESFSDKLTHSLRGFE